jgi:hypothetical protein
MAELVAVATDENVEDLARDLGEWLRWHLTVRSFPPEVLPVTMDTTFVWNDDGDPGARKVTVVIGPDTTKGRAR